MNESISRSNDNEVTISKRLFFIGCLFLPWLWILNSYYYRHILFYDNFENLSNIKHNINPNIKYEEVLQVRKWVKLSISCSILFLIILIIWNIIFQITYKENNWEDLLVYEKEQESGW